MSIAPPAADKVPTDIVPVMDVVFGFWKPLIVNVKTFPSSMVTAGKFAYVIDLSDFIPRQLYFVLWRPSLQKVES